MGCFVDAEFLLTSALCSPSAIAEPLVLQRETILSLAKGWQNTPKRAWFCSRDPFLPRNNYAKLGICRRRVSVCVSVILRYCIKTAKRRITQITPHDSPLTLVFWHQSSLRNSEGITPYRDDKWRWGGLKFLTFDEKRAITRKQYQIDAQFLLKLNRKSYVLYWMAMFPTTLGNP